MNTLSSGSAGAVLIAGPAYGNCRRCLYHTGSLVNYNATEFIRVTMKLRP